MCSVWAKYWVEQCGSEQTNVGLEDVCLRTATKRAILSWTQHKLGMNWHELLTRFYMFWQACTDLHLHRSARVYTSIHKHFLDLSSDDFVFACFVCPWYSVRVSEWPKPPYIVSCFFTFFTSLPYGKPWWTWTTDLDNLWSSDHPDFARQCWQVLASVGKYGYVFGHALK